MYLVVHVLAGILFAIIFKNPWLVLLFALVSHFILDMIPHWQLVKAGEKFSKRSVISSFFNILTTLIVILIFLKVLPNNLTLFFGIIGSIIPDLDDALFFWSIKNKCILGRYKKWHDKIQNEVSFVYGASTQLIIILISIILILNLIL